MVKPKNRRQAERQRFSRRAMYDPNDDIALLSIPFEASIKGVGDLIRAFENGTQEVKYLLQFECGLLFECRVCKGIFRSIVNFITHKRVYCRARGHTDGSQTGDSFNEFMKDIHSLVVVQEPVTNLEPIPTTVTTNGSSVVEEEKPVLAVSRFSKRKGFPRKNLVAVLDRLSIKEATAEDEPVTARSRACLPGFVDSKPPATVLSLEKIEHTDVAMRQTVTLGPDGKIVSNVEDNKDVGTDDNHDGDMSVDQECESNQSEAINIEKLCKPCNVVFSTRKTYRQHLKSKHSSNRSWYLCPDCTNVFSQVYSVQRHLRRFHNKSEAQMRKLHGKIKYLSENQLPQPYFNSVMQKKPISKIAQHETKRLVESQRQENFLSYGTAELKGKDNICNACHRKFDRVAAFNSHTQTCPKRPHPPSCSKQQSSSSESVSSLPRSSTRNSAGEVPLTKSNVAENSDIEIVLDKGKPRHVSARSDNECDSLPDGDEDNVEVPFTTSEFQNVPSSASINHRGRHESDMRLEPPVKRIEIQLRMDYNKVITGSSQSSAARDDAVNLNKASNVVEASLLACLANDDKEALLEGQPSSSNVIHEDLQTFEESGVICKPIKERLATINKTPRKFKGLTPDSHISSISGSDDSTETISESSKLKTYTNSVLASRLTCRPMSYDATVNLMGIFETPTFDGVLGIVSSEENDTASQPVNNSDVLDRIEPFLNESDTHCKQKKDVDDLTSGTDHDLKVELLSINATSKMTEILQGKAKNISKKKIVCYKCTKCLHNFGSLADCNNHIKKMHGNNVGIHKSHDAEVSDVIGAMQASTSQQCGDMNGDINEYPMLLSQDSEIFQPAVISNSHDVDNCIDELEPPNKLFVKECSSSLKAVSISKSNSKFTKSFISFESPKVQIVKGKPSPCEQAVSPIRLRPKRQPHPKRAWSNTEPTKSKHTITKVFEVAKQNNMKPARKVQRGVAVFKREALEKSKIAPASKRLKLVATKSTALQEDVPPPENSIVPTESQVTTDSVKLSVQDNTNVYKNVDKSLIEIIFGSEMGHIFSSENFSNEEDEVTIIEDQINGTFSVDISCSTPEKIKEISTDGKTDTEDSPPVPIRRRTSFSTNSNKRRSSSADSAQRRTRILNSEISHSMENISPTKPLFEVEVGRSCSTEQIKRGIIVNSVDQELAIFQDSKGIPVIVLDAANTPSVLEAPHVVPVCSDHINCVGLPCKEAIVSTLETFPQEKSKPSDGKTTINYNISTRKSVRVMDTKPL